MSETLMKEIEGRSKNAHFLCRTDLQDIVLNDIPALLSHVRAVERDLSNEIADWAEIDTACDGCAPDTFDNGYSQASTVDRVRWMKEQISTLRAENSNLKGWLETETMNRESFEALRAENLRLREALGGIASNHRYETPAGTINCRFCDNNMDLDEHAPTCEILKARAALASKQEGEK